MDRLGDDLIKMTLLFSDLADVSGEVRSLLRVWRNDPFISKSMISCDFITEEQHSMWVDSVLKGQSSKVSVVFCDDKPIGMVSIRDIDFVQGYGEWGLYIGERDYIGRGLGSSMVQHIIDWGFSDLGLRRLYTSVLSTNERALAMYIRHGFRVEGCWREHLLRDGKAVDLYWMGMLRSGWAPSRS